MRSARGSLGPVAALAGALALLALGFVCAPLDDVLREDALSFLDRAFVLRAGDWTASNRSHGWPMLLAGVLELLGLDTRAEAMPVARLLSIVLIAACAFPVASLARRVAGERAAVLAVLALVTSPTLVWLGGIAYSDPLFLLLATTSAAVAAASGGRMAPLLWATALASLSYWVRPNGLFMLAALLVYAALARRRAGLPLRPLLWMPLVFVAISLPHLVLRAQAFGSPFSYGEVSNFLVDDYAEIWDPSSPRPSLLDYLSTHTPAQWFHKFVVRGLFRVAWYFLHEIGVLGALLLGCGLWCWLRVLRSRAAAPDLAVPALMVAALLLGLVPVFDVMGEPRYMAATLPFVFVIGAAGFATLVAGTPRERLLLAAIGLVLVAQVPVAFARGQLHVRTTSLALGTPHVRDEWAHWTVRHVPAPVAIVEGEDLLQLAFEAARAAGELPAEAAARTDYPTRRPGPRSDLGVALDEFERFGIRHVLVDSRNIGRVPYLRDLYEPRWAGRVQRVQSFRSRPDERWALADMDIYRIVPRPGG